MVKSAGKIWMAIASILLISLIGTASAIRSIGRNPDALELLQGESGTFTINVTAQFGTDDGYFGVNISQPTSGFYVVIKNSTGAVLASGYGNKTVSTSKVSYILNQTTTLYVDITNNNAPQGDYTVIFTANDGDKECTEGTIKACLSSEIPEFATIAVPVAALLLLIFVFNQRKRRQ
ncbi:MAG: PEF-CTERM sorting domain-containing protein [Candidatus Methanospirare jalkutatii]|nr:PEF-CTERM sorting domain-containing protein [Candidatus Methanospirare jalkutatii]